MTRANHTGQPAVACTRGEQLYADYIHAHEELSQGDVALVGCDEQCNERLIERFKFRKIKDMAFNTNIKVGSTYRAVSYMHCGAQDWLLECDSTADLGSKAATMLGTSPGGWCRAKPIPRRLLGRFSAPLERIDQRSIHLAHLLDMLVLELRFGAEFLSLNLE